MSTLNSAQRKYLKAQAHHLEPLVLVGKNGITPTLIDSVELNLEAHELIKVKFNDHKPEKRALSEQIEKDAMAQLVDIIGHVAIFYRENRDPEKRRFTLPA